MRFIDFVRDRARYYNCPACGRSLRDCELRMLQHVEDRYTIQVTCAACRVQFIVPSDDLALERGLADDADLLSTAMRSDQATPEPEPIQSDEVLDVHLLLRDYRGRLTDLFKQPSGDRN
jgi:hypothetical protein